MSYGLHHNAKRLAISIGLGTDRISENFILGITRAPQAAAWGARRGTGVGAS